MAGYIFYTHNTFTNYHISMALESIEKQAGEFKFDEFIIYNNSTDIKTEFIVNQFYNLNLQNKFKKSVEWKVVPYDHKYFKL